MAAGADKVQNRPVALVEPLWDCSGPVLPGICNDAACSQSFDALRGPRHFTLCASVRRAPGETQGGAIAQQGDAPSAGWRFEAPSSVGVVAFVASRQSADGAREAEQPRVEDAGEPSSEQPSRGEYDIGRKRLDDGLWHHVAVVYSEGSLRAFVDGGADGAAKLQISKAPVGSLLHLGPPPPLSLEEGGTEAMTTLSRVKDDVLRDVQVYAEALSEAQIEELATGRGKELPSGLTLALTPRDVSRFWARSGESGLARPGDEGIAVASDQGGHILGERLDVRCIMGASAGDFQRQVLIAFFSDLLSHCRLICLTSRKTAVFLAIVHALFARMRLRSETSLRVGEVSSVSECFAEYKRWLTAHMHIAALPGRQQQHRLDVFTLPEAQQLTDFVSEVLFRHFVLYQSVLICSQEAIVSYADVLVKRPRRPPDLSKAKLQTKK